MYLEMNVYLRLCTSVYVVNMYSVALGRAQWFCVWSLDILGYQCIVARRCRRGGAT